jgi:hypothetical protein
MRPHALGSLSSHVAPAALPKLHSLWRVLLLRMALVVTLGLLTAVALSVAAAFNNEFAWLLMLTLVASLIPVFAAATRRFDAVGRTAGSLRSAQVEINKLEPDK